MERDQIVREDFPTARKGWNQDAVRTHLSAVAAAFPDATQAPTPAADLTSGRVQSVLAAAESAAAEILEEAHSEADRLVAAAQADADQIRAAARNESKQKVSAADREATTRVEQARGAVEGLIAQADKLRAQVGAVGRDLASNMSGGSSLDDFDDPVVPPDPVVVPDAAPAPARTGAAKSIRIPEPEVDVDVPAPAISGSEDGAARLVAMNMALDGASREQIAAQLGTEFGEVANVEILLDDVLRRANR